MKRTFKFLLAGAFAVVFASMALTSCSDDEDEIKPDDEVTYDDAYYASQATVTSSDSNYTATDEGGEIWFKTEGGSVTLSVSCGTEWTADNSASDHFSTSLTSTALTVTAEQNTVEEELTGTITLKTAAQGISFATITVTQAAYGAPEITVAVSEVSFPACGDEMTAEIAVEATADWTAEAADIWLTVEKTDAGITITAADNEETAERATKVTLTCTDGISTVYEFVDVSQGGAAYVTLSAEELVFPKAGGTAEVSVDSNYEWDYAYDDEGEWFSVAQNNDGSLTVTVAATVSGNEREGTVSITASDGAANVAEATLTITQNTEDPDALILEYTITAEDTKIQLPVYSDNDDIYCAIDWGDGSDAETIENWPAHTYSSPGTYSVHITGNVPALASATEEGSGALVMINIVDGCTNLTAVKQWGAMEFDSMHYAFFDCTNLASFPDGPGPFEKVTAFEHAFDECTSLTSIPEDFLSTCTEADDFYYAFAGCTSLISLPQGLFATCTEATTFAYAFENCYALTSVPEDLFANCTKVEDFGGIFWNTSLTAIPEKIFANCPEAEYFDDAFRGCSELTDIPVGLFDNNTKVTYFSETFYNCSAVVGESPYTEIEVDGETVKVHLYERENYPDYFTAPESYSQCFTNSSFTDYEDIPSDWKTSSGGGMTPMPMSIDARKAVRTSSK